jgi:putative oxidoreductase
MVDVVALVGRALFVVLFVAAGLGHVTRPAAMAGYADSRGVPAAKVAVFGSGVLMLAGAVSVLLGVYMDLGMLLLVVFLVPTAVLMHPFWREAGADRQNEQVQFEKDIALAGAALLVLVLYAGPGAELGLTITGPLWEVGS